MLTSKQLTKMGVKHHLVVEPDELEDYQRVVKKWKLKAEILKLDLSYKEEYNTCDNEGLSKSTGSGPARNFIWDYSVRQGENWHWIMDDNIKSFRRLYKNEKIKIKAPSFWRVMEDFVLQYKNIAMAGPRYFMFCPDRVKNPPLTFNTRVYSCNLIRNDIPFRWRGRYNEDTILSLDILKAGWCTVLFNYFLQEKSPTQTVSGGNTQEIYQEGTLPKSKMLAREYPNLVDVVWKWGRWHHEVDYSLFKKTNILEKREHPPPTGNYNMKLVVN